MLTRLLVLTALLGTAACALAPPGSGETDRVASTVAHAISWPRQESADGLLRAAVATAAGQDGRLAVLVAEPLEAPDLEDPLAHLVLRVHLEGTQSGWTTTDPVTACYDADFTWYGIVGEPSRTRCPDLEPLVPAPLAPQPTRVLPAGAADVVARALRVPDLDGVRRAIVDGLPPAAGPDELPPTLLLLAQGEDVGVSLSGDGDRCVLGSRIDGRTRVWRPAPEQLQPGELTCAPDTALAGHGAAP